jgi:hypothetical protein
MKVLKETSEIVQKFRKVENLMSDLGITIDFDGFHMVISDDRKPTESRMFIVDAESNEHSLDIPAICETKIILDE